MTESTGRCLVLDVFLHDGRFHGVPDWPPSPARLFQALVAGAARGASLSAVDEEALRWLEAQAAPEVGAPRASRGQAVKLWVPNNDLDAKGGDPSAASEIRVDKSVQPWIFEPEVPFRYVWQADAIPEQVMTGIEGAALRLYQLGRGVDMAWARTWAGAEQDVDAAWAGYPGTRHHPSAEGSGGELVCPMPGTLDSLRGRFESLTTSRFETQALDRKTLVVFTQAPKSRVRTVAYRSPPRRRMYELRTVESSERLAVWPLPRASDLAHRVRDAVVSRLMQAMPSLDRAIDGSLIGRDKDGKPSRSSAHRVRIIPLPSIGHEQVDQGIRRVLVEAPTGTGITLRDLFWAFSGLEISNENNTPIRLIEAADRSMLRHFGVPWVETSRSAAHRLWRTVTPAALPAVAARRRIDPDRISEEHKAAEERKEEESRAAFAARQALRHAGIAGHGARIVVRREPFDVKGSRAEAFAHKPRFRKELLWHVEISFSQPVDGPIVIGDGRFLGLGVMAPVQGSTEPIAFDIVQGLAGELEAEAVARAFRRAAMARLQRHLGHGAKLPEYVTGHRDDGAATDRGHGHVAFVFDPVLKRLLVVPPEQLTRDVPTDGTSRVRRRREHLDLYAALAGLDVLRAGRAGRLRLAPSPVQPERDPLFMSSRRWRSVTPYCVTRHHKSGDPGSAVAEDIRRECHRVGLPEPGIHVTDARGTPGAGLHGRAELTFRKAIRGPLLLGRSKHRGGGVFAAVEGLTS